MKLHKFVHVFAAYYGVLLGAHRNRNINIAVNYIGPLKSADCNRVLELACSDVISFHRNALG